jgi:hypothetical protein
MWQFPRVSRVSRLYNSLTLKKITSQSQPFLARVRTRVSRTGFNHKSVTLRKPHLKICNGIIKRDFLTLLTVFSTPQTKSVRGEFSMGWKQSQYSHQSQAYIWHCVAGSI